MKIHQKLEYLIAMCSEEFIKDCIFIREITSWMGENDFTEFFNHLCSMWGIKNPDDVEDTEETD